MYAPVHPVIVDGLEPPETKQVYTMLVGLDEDFGADLGTIRGDSIGEEDITHESLHVVQVTMGRSLLLPFVMAAGVDNKDDNNKDNNNNDNGGGIASNLMPKTAAPMAKITSD